MPNINKPFLKVGISCYKCNRLIEYGTFNWSYNTRSAGNPAHKDCIEAHVWSGVTPKEKVEPKIEPKVELTVKPTVEPTQIRTKTKNDPMGLFRSGDITDRIKTSDCHYQVGEDIKGLLAEREYPLLHGIPGTGKSFVCEQIAHDMQIEYYPITMSPDMYLSNLLGTVSPVSGKYQSTKFRSVWDNGGLVLLDEVALSNGTFLSTMNNALSNKILSFPDGTLRRAHKHFFLIAADNSNLWGDDPLYPERQDAGGSFRSRISYVNFKNDERVELKVVTTIFKGDKKRAEKWHNAVKDMRLEIERNPDLEALNICPRFTYRAAKMMRSRGDSFSKVCEQHLFEGRENTDPDWILTCVKALERFQGRY